MFNNRCVELIATLFVRFVFFLFNCFVFIIICYVGRYTYLCVCVCNNINMV